MLKFKKILFLLFIAILLSPMQTVARPTHIRVGLVSRFNGSSAITVNNTDIMYPFGVLNSPSGFVLRPYSANHVVLYCGGGGRLRVFDGAMQISDAFGGMMLLNGHPYRGTVEFARLGGAGLTAINILPLEEYLFSVVPSEMPSTWHMEALKAQAVAARTYALDIITRGSSHTGFDLCDRTCCQVYRGAERERERTTSAVLATSGMAAFFNGQLIEAVYFASSGGFTENSENVWGAAKPYLVSVADPHEFEPVIWSRSFTLNEITHLLTLNGHGFVGTATSVSIGNVFPSGRVENLIIQGTSGQVILERENIRTFFSQSTEGSLKSRNFVISGGAAGSHTVNEISITDGWQTLTTQASGLYIIDAHGHTRRISAESNVNSAAGDTIVMTGRGFGHGVGMSQRGAEGMARRGYTFREILTHFYTGITIE